MITAFRKYKMETIKNPIHISPIHSPRMMDSPTPAKAIKHKKIIPTIKPAIILPSKAEIFSATSSLTVSILVLTYAFRFSASASAFSIAFPSEYF